MMRKWKTFVTRTLPEQAIAILRDVSEVAVWEHEETPVPRDRLLAGIADADAVLTMLTDRVDAEFFSAAAKVKVVANLAVGYDNIDLTAARRRGVTITNTPDILTETTADLTFGLLLATARRIPEAAGFVRQGRWVTWSPMLLVGQDVYGAKMGIIGMGRIGEAVARRARGFAMDVIYYNRRRRPDVEQRLGVEYRPFDELLCAADFVVLLAPLTPETVHLIGERELRLMKANAILINTGRGPLVDEAALFAALASRRIYAAGLDVFEKEPIASDHPLLRLPNVVALPHIGSASIATRTKMAVHAANNIHAVLSGVSPQSPVALD